MSAPDRLSDRLTRNPLLALFLVFVAALWIAGGASRPNVPGQAVVRAVAWACLIAMIAFKSGWTVRRGHAAIVFVGAGVLLAIFQIIPLPPAVWLGLPGRSLFQEAASIAGEPAPWRPLAIYPTGTINALGSLIVPVVALVFVTGRVRIDDGSLIKVMLGLVVCTMVVGLLQFAGLGIRNPLVNGSVDVSGTLANRNHFALVMATGFLLTAAWAVSRGGSLRWKGSIGMAIAVMLVLSILASGSRAGMLVGAVAIGCSLVMIRHRLRRAFEHYPRWVFFVVPAGIIATIALIIAISIEADRAVSITRALTIDPAQDMRSMAFNTVIAMVTQYFPVGSGLGGFDAVFRMREPLSLLKPTYFNRAHNDFVEIVLDTGIIGLVLLLLGTGWWTRMSWRAWRTQGSETMLPKLGSAMILIILIASIVDYPARTPVIMVLAVIAGVWLGEAGSSALPKSDEHL
ncbi:O-antigen ligase family protein [Sphingomonas sp. Leaf37]|uniref:O-antigen ligase family protein n=1 Tax=Sphingomonas sp. Leaf37 TaxID=2876552 RepID=UPI001E566CF7|nr:O-antigen ligase family protein [Sphingomonas sp. Leaf37]